MYCIFIPTFGINLWNNMCHLHTSYILPCKGIHATQQLSSEAEKINAPCLHTSFREKNTGLTQDKQIRVKKKHDPKIRRSFNRTQNLASETSKMVFLLIKHPNRFQKMMGLGKGIQMASNMASFWVS